MTYRDKTYCASPQCKNECGRQMAEWERDEIAAIALCGKEVLISQSYFCGTPEEQDDGA